MVLWQSIGLRAVLSKGIIATLHDPPPSPLSVYIFAGHTVFWRGNHGKQYRSMCILLIYISCKDSFVKDRGICWLTGIRSFIYMDKCLPLQKSNYILRFFCANLSIFCLARVRITLVRQHQLFCYQLHYHNVLEKATLVSTDMHIDTQDL